MDNYRYIKLRQFSHLADTCAQWFESKWGIPKQTYLQSMKQCMEKDIVVPQWYVVVDGDKIVGGAGVIENDFHNCKHLSPNVCAVFVEENYRKQGIAGRLLDFICKDMSQLGVKRLYLVTDHVGFYERYGWQFLCMAQSDGEDQLSRLYTIPMDC